MLHKMAVRMTVLASGSRGNCTVFSSSCGSILVDAGLSCRETLKRMKAAGEDPRQLKAIVISHEHNDHVAGAQVLSRKLKIPVYMTAATYESWRRSTRDAEGRPAKLEWHEPFQAGQSFSIGGIAVNPFTTCHDAADPCGFTFNAEGMKVGIAIDLGCITRNVAYALRGCDGLMIESNHDIEMLRNGSYPEMVKHRIRSRDGHLSNSDLAKFLADEYDGGAVFIVLAHLSEENNHPELARQTATQALSGKVNLFQASTLAIAQQDKPLQPLQVG
ncbi:MAG TPA: MBL fold metallo-hydrolase [Candidatus Angelobacter sp.]